MNFSPQQINAAYKKLPEEVQDFITSPDITEIISSSLKASGLTGEKLDLADSEILYSMYGLQSLEEAIKNISEVSQKNSTEFLELKTTLEKEAFSIINDLVRSGGSVPQNSDPIISISTVEAPKEFEIGNNELKDEQTTHTLPMIEPREVAREVPHVETKDSAPSQQEGDATPQPEAKQPAEEKKRPELSFPKSSYVVGKDPYREPIE